MVWLSQQPSWSNAREIAISTQNYGLSSSAELLPGEEADGTERKMGYLPSFDSSYTLWYNHHYVRITRTKVREGYSTTETLTLRQVFCLKQ
jgi:chaperone BCS1